MLVAIRNSWECDKTIKTNTIIVPHIEVHTAALVAVEEAEELVHEDPGDAGGQQQPVHVLQLLLAQLPARTLQVETSAVELKELSFFLTFIILHALFNTPMCVDSENLCMRSPALLKKVRNPSKK